MKLIDDRDIRTKRRKIAKKQYDKEINLSVGSSQKVRLLDEGAIVNAYGNIDFFIKKGTLEKYYESLDDDFVGTINFGHHDFATFPVILGTWTKKDLSLVDTGDGRKGLDVKVKLYEENPFVVALKQMPYEVAISSEFTYHVDEDSTRSFGFMVVDELNIDAFAIVGEPGNVNSDGLRLNAKGEQMKLKELMDTLNAEGTKVDIEKLNKALDLIIEEEDKKELEVETAEEAEVETEEKAEEEHEEEPQKEAEEAVLEPSKEEPEEEPVEEAKEAVETANAPSNEEVMTVLNSLKADLDALKAERDQLREELNAKEKAEAEFTEKFKHLTVSLSQEPETKEDTVYYTDGIGE